MRKLFSNSLLSTTVFLVVLYWIFSLILPNQYISSTSSLLLLIAGALTMIRYAPYAYQIVFNGLRSDDKDGEGSHLYIYGATLLGLGSCYIGTFGLLWVYFGQPDGWTGTGASGFGRAIMAAGFWLIYISPPSKDRTVASANTIWLAAIIILALIITFFVGTQVGSQEQLVSRPVSKTSMAMSPICLPTHPIWVANGSKVFHDKNSAWSGRSSPAKCFRSADDAIKSGYRPAS